MKNQNWDKMKYLSWIVVRDQRWNRVKGRVGGRVRSWVWDRVGRRVEGRVGDRERELVWDRVGEIAK